MFKLRITSVQSNSKKLDREGQ